ncbi:MAG: hypothetical protein QM658_07920 [Gordonia sp. (in: high G+C Gram-positive bacteria)]
MTQPPSPGPQYPPQQYSGQQYPAQQPYAGSQYPPQGYQQGYPSHGYQPGVHDAHAAYQHPDAGGPNLYQATFNRHTGLVFVALTSPKTVVGTYDEVRRAFWASQAHCLTLGWWGILSALIYNWMAIIGNVSTLSRVKSMARENGDA